jgi:hypothetical protein
VHSAFDPPEPWEQQGERAPDASPAPGFAAHPYVPARWTDVPSGAFEALESACGAWRLDQLFVVPTAARSVVDDPEAWITTPAQVVGLAEERVAHWIDADPQPHIAAALALDELAAIDHAQIGPYMRLTLLAHDRRLTVRYDTVARHELDPALCALRAAATGCPLPVPDEPELDLSHEWAHLVHSTAVRLQAGEPIAVRLGQLPTHARDHARGALLALTPHELILAREPNPDLLAGSAPSGHDLLSIPRGRLEGAEVAAAGARLRTGGVEIDLALPQSLAHGFVEVVERGRPGDPLADRQLAWAASRGLTSGS